MLRVVTRNSVYTVQVDNGGFTIRRTADLWGRKVSDNHYHRSLSLTLAVGRPMLTDELTTSPVVAIVAYDAPARDNHAVRPADLQGYVPLR